MKLRSTMLLTALVSFPLPAKSIYYGTNAPYQMSHFNVAIYRTNNGSPQFWCGGSMIGPKWVLTAAHCVQGQTLDFLRVGCLNRAAATGCTDIDLSGATMHPHPSFSSTTGRHDIALIELPEAFDLVFQKSGVRVATVAEATLSVGASVNAFGWGYTDTSSFTFVDQLKTAQINVASTSATGPCNSVSKPFYPAEQICAGGPSNRDTCLGDSGGPITINGMDSAYTSIVVGVVSHGVPGVGCGLGPAVYTNVGFYRSWIEGIAAPISTTGFVAHQLYAERSFAEQTCVASAKHLVSIASPLDNVNASMALSAAGLITSPLAITNGTKPGFWLGGFDIGHEGSWNWVANGALFCTGYAPCSPINGAFTAWASGRPINSMSESCLVFSGQDLTWSDRACGRPRAFLCR